MSQPGLDIRLLGPVSVSVDGRELVIPSPKQRVILAMLALARRVSVDAMAEELWRETPPASVAATVQTLVSRLRRALDEVGAQVAIHAESGGYVVEMEPSCLDVHRFGLLAEAGRRALAKGDSRQARDCFRQALALWRGEVLADLADRHFAMTAAVRLVEGRLEVAEGLADAELDLGRPADALQIVEPLIGEHPFRERLWRTRMVALYRLGRQADALAAYQDLRRTLADELGLEPSPGLRETERQILLQCQELDGPQVPLEASHGLEPEGSRVPYSSGTLVFLFTDIEASTKRWESDRGAMAHDLERHDRVLRDVVAAHGGDLFTHTGDGLGAVFPTVPSALAAALAGQNALREVTWHGTAPLRVRMVLHVGTAEARDGTYLGPTLNRAARLLDLASGGQILCSQAVADLARDELPADVSLADWGEHRLSGLSRRERVWQVMHPNLPGSQSALPAVPTRPVAPTPFVGREVELSDLSSLLAESRLLTLTGLGGAGKTRLALELATRSEKEFVDGVCVVELAALRDDNLVAAEVAAALGIDTGPSGISVEERVTQVLAERHLLLVLDNCEHLLEPVGTLVDKILRRCPHVTVIATSREVLSLSGETAWSTPGLSLPPEEASEPEHLEGSDAAGLLVARARTALPGFGVTSTNAGHVAQICRRLDGIPLALELAAARVRVLGIAQLAERLDDRFRLLTGGPRSAPSRHQTLQAAMDWSFEMLPEPERRLLRQLSVFPQSFDLDAATAVAGMDAHPIDVLDLLARLVDKSLLAPRGVAETARYQLLETVRDYGALKLTRAGEDAEARRRHRRHFVGLVESRYRLGPAFYGLDWARHVALERENYQAALVSAVNEKDWDATAVILTGLHYSWYWWPSVPTVIDSIDPHTLSCSDPSFHVEALLALCTAGWVTNRFDSDAIRRILERSRKIADEAGTGRDQGFARYFLGYLARGQGDSACARSWMEESLP